MSNSQFILASSSPYRKILLNKIIPTFTCISPNIDETPLISEKPKELVLRLAQTKAQTVAQSIKSPSIIIASDQLATFNNEVIGKPHTKENARKQLKSFSGKSILFYTSLCVLNTETRQSETIVEPFSVYFKNLSDLEISNYINKENPLDCAGSFKSEGLGIALFEKLEGDDPNTLIGLPLIRLCKILDNMGISVLG